MHLQTHTNTQVGAGVSCRNRVVPVFKCVCTVLHDEYTCCYIILYFTCNYVCLHIFVCAVRHMLQAA